MLDLPYGSQTNEDSAIWAALRKGPLKVAVVGAGNWGTTVANIAALNAASSYIFLDSVKMWVLEEEIDGRKLTEIINTDHENPKYLPGIKLTHNLVAESDLLETVKDADLLAFVLPHQFVENVCLKLKGHVKPFAKAISFVKGMSVSRGMPKSMSDLIREILGVRCCSMSGANVARDVAHGQFSECTLGFHDAQKDVVAVWQQLFDRPYFRISPLPDVHGVEICGALKNIVAIAAGFSDGLGCGTNTKAAIIRIGVTEVKLFASLFFNDVLDQTFEESCGYADTITTCFGGRNVRCAKEFVVRGGKSSWDDIERELLHGQKIQGHLAAKEVYEILTANSLLEHFPLFTATYKIAFEGAAADSILRSFQEAPVRPIPDIHTCRRTQVPDALKSDFGEKNDSNSPHHISR